MFSFFRHKKEHKIGSKVAAAAVALGGTAAFANPTPAVHAATITTTTNSKDVAYSVTIQNNQNLSEIAQKNKVSVSDLAVVNHLSPASKLQAGTKVQIPNYYTVHEGESVSSIAAKLGYKTEDILEANNLTWNNARININQKLKLPNTKQVTSTTKTSVNTQSTNNSGVISIAKQYLGVPYVWGGSSPSGFDCSGLTQYVYKQAGINIPRTSQAQSELGQAKPISQAKPGDLLFWGAQGSAYHVAIYIGNGNYIQAPAPGQSVTIQSISNYSPNFAVSVQ